MKKELKNERRKKTSRQRREWHKYRASVEPFNLARAVWLGNTSAIIVSMLIILSSYSPRENSFSPFLNPVYITLANVVLYNLLYLFFFWIQRRNLSSTILSNTLCLIGSLLITLSHAYLSFRLEELFFHHASYPLPMNMRLALMAGATAFLITQLLNNINQRQRIAIENEQLKTENFQNRYQTLQRQVHPHFLFNSLNTLDGLVGEDDKGAHDYIAQLAAIFRYVMNKPEEVTLEEELTFTRSYLYLMQIRYGAEQLRVEEQVDPSFLRANLLAISVQTLVENAIKHNIISKQHPLTIGIRTTPSGHLVVDNAFQPRVDHEEADSGIGLQNLASRYRLRYHREISVQQGQNTFSVTIPLILPPPSKRKKIKQAKDYDSTQPNRDYRRREDRCSQPAAPAESRAAADAAGSRIGVYRGER